MTFGLELRRLRRERGLTTRALGALIPCSHVHIIDLENNRRRATPQMVARLDDVLQAQGQLTTAAAPALPVDDGIGELGAHQVADLTTFLQRAAGMWCADQQDQEASATPTVTGAQAIVSMWSWENLPEDPDVASASGGQVGSSDVEILRAARVRYEHMYRQTGGVATRPRVVAFLNHHAAPLLHGRYTGSTGRDLFRAAGSLATVAGICAYDAAAQGRAQRYFHQALRFSKASGDRRFGGYVIALLVNQAFIMGDLRESIAFADAGLPERSRPSSAVRRAGTPHYLARPWPCTAPGHPRQGRPVSR